MIELQRLQSPDYRWALSKEAVGRQTGSPVRVIRQYPFGQYVQSMCVLVREALGCHLSTDAKCGAGQENAYACHWLQYPASY